MLAQSINITENQAFGAQIIHLPQRLSIVQAPQAKQPVRNQSLSTYSPYKLSPSFIGISLTLALHAAGLLILFTGETQPKPQPASPIRVALLSAPRHETLKPQAKPQNKKAEVKPKKALNPKPILSALSHASEQTPSPEAPTAPLSTIDAKPASAAQESQALETPITLPHINADYLNNPAPDYPPTSRQSGEQGRVLVRALIDAEGRVERIELRKTSGYSLLDQAALNTVKNWRFVPAHRGEQPVSAWIVVPISFTLEG